MEASDFSPEYEDAGQESESNEIIAEIASVEEKLRLKVIQTLLEPCDRKTYGKRLRTADEQLNCDIRTVQRLVKKVEKEGLAAFAQNGRRDKGIRRISQEWQDFIVAAYDKGKCTLSPIGVAVQNNQRMRSPSTSPIVGMPSVWRKVQNSGFVGRESLSTLLAFIR